MSDKFDKILKNRIKGSLEQNKIAYDPKHWEQLKAKKNKKKRVAFWYWRIASVLALLLMTSLFVNYFVNQSTDENIEFEQKVNSDEYIPKSLKDSLQNPQDNLIAEINDTLNSLSTPIWKIKKNYKLPKNKVEEYNIAINKITEIDDVNSKTTPFSEISKLNSKSISEDVNNISTLDVDNNDSALNSKELNEKRIDSISENLELLVDNSIEIEKSILNKKLKMGVLVSSLYNLNESISGNDMAVSSGLSLEIPISNKFEIFVGAVYSKQSFNLLSQHSKLSGIASAKGNNIILKSRASSINALEIPFNLKYSFKINEKQFFVSSGISSIQYFNEKIENTFIENDRNKISGRDNNGNSFVQYELKQTENSVESSIDSDKFEILGSFNISAGVLIPISDSNQNLIIEPFFKYSLSSITSQNVDYSNLGIQLRYNFNFKK